MLFTDRYTKVLSTVFDKYRYSISEETAARSIDPRTRDQRWMRPLPPHLDAFFHDPEFTVNFWLPFQARGDKAPSLAVVCAPFDSICAFTASSAPSESLATTGRSSTPISVSLVSVTNKLANIAAIYRAEIAVLARHSRRIRPASLNLLLSGVVD